MLRAWQVASVGSKSFCAALSAWSWGCHVKRKCCKRCGVLYAKKLAEWKRDVWSLSLNWNLTSCQLSVSALMIPCLGGDIGKLLPTVSLEYIYLATAAIQTTFLVQLAMGGKFRKVAVCRMRMWIMSRLKSMELESCAYVTVYFFLEASVKLTVCYWMLFYWNTNCLSSEIGSVCERITLPPEWKWGVEENQCCCRLSAHVRKEIFSKHCTSKLSLSKEKFCCDKSCFLFWIGWKGKFWYKGLKVAVSLVPGLLFWAVNFSS